MSVAGGPGRVNLVLRALGDLAIVLVRGPGPIGGALLAAVLATAAWTERRRSRPAAAGLSGFRRGIWTIGASALMVRTVVVPSAVPFEGGTSSGWSVGSETINTSTAGATYDTPIVALPVGTEVRIEAVVGDAPVVARLRDAGQNGDRGEPTDASIVTTQTGGAVVQIESRGPTTVDAIVLDATPWAAAR